MFWLKCVNPFFEHNTLTTNAFPVEVNSGKIKHLLSFLYKIVVCSILGIIAVIT